MHHRRCLPVGKGGYDKGVGWEGVGSKVGVRVNEPICRRVIRRPNKPPDLPPKRGSPQRIPPSRLLSSEFYKKISYPTIGFLFCA